MNLHLALVISAVVTAINLTLWLEWWRDRSAQRQYAREQTSCANGDGPDPLPVRYVEASQRFKVARDCWPLLVGQENDGTVWVVVRRKELPSPPPANFLEHSNDFPYVANDNQEKSGGAA